MRRNLALVTAMSFLAGLFVAIAPGDSASASTPGGSGLAVQIRPDSRSLAWVKSQGFDAWGPSVRDGNPNCHSAADQPLIQEFGQSAPGGSCPTDNFLAYYSGFLLAPATGKYNFRVLANDAFELRINGSQVVRNWNSTSAAGSTLTSTANVELQAGVAYPISFWYRDFTKEAHFRVSWKYPGSGDFAEIPIANLDSNLADLLGSSEQRFTCPAGIGMSPDCPAYSPQEIFDIHGTQADGEYWLLVAGVATRVHVLMDPVYAGIDGSGFLQLMHIGSSNGGGYTGLSGSGARFNYDSPLWTDQLLTLNADRGVYTTSKRNTYNFTPVSKVMSIFHGSLGLGFGAANYSISRTGNTQNLSVVTGDIQLPNPTAQSPHIWVENVPAVATGKPALYTFDNQVDQTETVIEPVNDANPAAGLNSTQRTNLKRIKIPIDDARKNTLLGVIDNRSTLRGRSWPNEYAIQTGKSGVFASAKNPYNEWYGFNFQSREWAPRTVTNFPLMKMRWGFYSMGYQTQFSKITSDGRDWSQGFANSVGEQAASARYAPSACNDGGCGQQLQYSFFAPKTRFVAIGGIGLNDANAAAYQPSEVGLRDVALSSGTFVDEPQCSLTPVGQQPDQPFAGYPCAYTSTIYGQMPNPNFANVTGVAAAPVEGGFNLTWNAVAGATEYVVATRKGSEPWKVTRVQNRGADVIFVPERGPGNYEFKVTARQYVSETNFNSSGTPAVLSRAVGVGLGGPDQVLVAGATAVVDLDAELANTLGVSGLAQGTTVGLTITLNNASKATLPNVAGLSSTLGTTTALPGPIELTPQANTITVYGLATAINNLLADVSYEHTDPANPIGSIRFEAFDAGTSTVKFNPANKHYYSVNQAAGTISFRDAYCLVATGSTHKTNSGGYDNCNSGGGRQNYNGVEGYPATITSSAELEWLMSSGLLGGLVATTGIANGNASANDSADFDDMWIGATNLEPGSSNNDSRYQWTNLSPTAERNQDMFVYAGSTGLADSLVPGIKFHKRNSDKFSVTLLRANITNYPGYLFVNADSSASDDVRSMLVEYSDANGGNPLYKSRTVSFALAPSITNTPAATATASSATMSIAVDPENSPAAVEVSYREQGQPASENKSAQLSAATISAAGNTTATFTGLDPITTYEYEITVTNAGGVDTETGTFTTGAAAAEVLGASARDVTHNSAEVGATVRANDNSVSSITVEYSTNSNLSTPQTQTASAAGVAGLDGQPVSVNLTGLAPETTYYYRTTVVNSAGSSQSEILSLETGKDLSAITAVIDADTATARVGSNFEVTANHPTEFPVDFSRNPSTDLLFASYTVKNITGVTLPSVWVELKDFVGGSVGLADPGTSSLFLGALAAGQSKTVYFPLKASFATEVDQQHVVSITPGEPGTNAAGAPDVARFVFDSVAQATSGGAATSEITDIRFNTSAPTLGGEFRVTVNGTVGEIEAGESVYLSPATNSSFPSDSLRLESTTITFPNLTPTADCPAIITGDLLLSNECYSEQQFEAVFGYRVVDTPTSNFAVSPSVATGGSAGFTTNDPSDTTPVLVNLRPQDTTTVTPSVTTTSPTAVSQNGVDYREVEFSIDVDSTSIRSSELDRVLVDLGPGAIFDLDSAELVIGGVRTPVNATLVDSTNNIVAIDGPIPASALADVKVVFDALIPEGNTPVPVKVSGQIGDSVVGSSPGLSTELSVTTPSSGSVTTTSATVADSPVAAAIPAGDVFQTTASLNAKVQGAPAGETLSFKYGPSSDLAAGVTTVTASPATTSGLAQEAFGASVTGLTPGSTYYYQAYLDGNPVGPVQTFTTKREDEPFVGLSNQPLPTAVICDEPELECEPISIQPPAVSCEDCTLTYEVTAGSLPAGLTLNPATGVISGEPTGAAGSYPFTLSVTATDGQNSSTASQTYNLVTAPQTAEPAAASAATGNISNTSAAAAAELAFVPPGELIRVIVTDLTDPNAPVVVTNEVIAEGTGAATQQVSYNLTGLSPNTEYSVRYQFGSVTTDPETFTTATTEVLPVAPSVTEATASIDSNEVTLTTTLANPLSGDTVGFLVGSTSDLTGATTVIAGAASTGSSQTLSTQVSGLSAGTYFYRVFFGDFSSSVFQFTIEGSQISQDNPVGSPSGVQVTSITPRTVDSCKPIEVTVLGSRLSGAVPSIAGVDLVVVRSSDSALVFEVPAGLASGTGVNLVIRSSSGTLTIQNALDITGGACATALTSGQWGKRFGNDVVKFYAKNPIGQGKVQFFANGREVAWIRAIDETDPKLSFADGRHYLVRSFRLQPGKNRVEIRVDGERVWRATYTRR
jgi:hypothetical protein